MWHSKDHVICGQRFTCAKADAGDEIVIQDQLLDTGVRTQFGLVIGKPVGQACTVEFLQRDGGNPHLPAIAVGQEPVDEDFSGVSDVDAIERFTQRADEYDMPEALLNTGRLPVSVEPVRKGRRASRLPLPAQLHQSSPNLSEICPRKVRQSAKRTGQMERHR